MSAARTVAGGGFGNVGLGDPGSPPRHKARPDLCPSEGHPFVTFHPYMGAGLAHSERGSSWCLCGDLRVDGDAVTLPKADDCGGSLVDCRHDLPPP